MAEMAVARDKAGGSFTGEIGVTSGSFTGEIGVTTAGSKKQPTGALVTERVPDAYIERIKRRPLRKMRPLKDSIAAGKPEYRERFLATNAHINYLVDLEQDCLRQYEEKGYAEIGVDYTDGFKKVFILPNPVD